MRTVYEFSVKDRKGNEVSLREYANEVLLIVNTATKCGFTPQYEELEKLYEKYHAQGFEILDFPCNQFGQQASTLSASSPTAPSSHNSRRSRSTATTLTRSISSSRHRRASPVGTRHILSTPSSTRCSLRPILTIKRTPTSSGTSPSSWSTKRDRW